MTVHDDAPSLVEVLRHRARVRPDAIAYMILDDDGAEKERLTYGALERRSASIAGGLTAIGVAGRPVLLSYETSLEFLAAFLGCLRAGAIAAPVAPSLRNEGLARLRAIASHADAALVLTSSDRIARLEKTVGGGLPLRTSESFGETERIGDTTGPTADQPAMLQYTSGSTGRPKGVIITHGNLMSNERAIRRAFNHHGSEVIVSWLPLFHDMGLIGMALHPLYMGCPAVLMSPGSFLRRPLRWLEAVSAYHGTTSGAPNFAYELCVRQITDAQIAHLDLSTWRVAFNGAERVRVSTLDRFADRFGACGFRRSAYLPCFGLAEATLFVTGGPSDAVDEVAVSRALDEEELIESCGRPGECSDVAIVDVATRRRCEDGRIGEIWVAGPSVAAGYWQDPDASRDTFDARIELEPDCPRYMRTGDMGFIRDGELYVTGRIKDLVVVRGRTIHPEDIEAAAERAHPAIPPSGTVAFSRIVDGEERVVVLVEVARAAAREVDGTALAGAVRRTIVEAHGLAPHAVELVRQRQLPRTSSGKVRRSACRLAYEANVLRRFADTPNVEAVEQEGDREDVNAPSDQENHTAIGARAESIIAWLRDYADHRLNSRLADERRCIAPHVVLDLGNQGAFGLLAPRSHDGVELRPSDFLRVLEQLGAIDQTTALLVGLHNVLGVVPISRWASGPLRDAVLPELARGRMLGSFALTEPGAGSNPGAMKSTARALGDGTYRIDGAKWFSGVASWSGIVNVFARELDTDGRATGTAAFVVRQETEGMRQGAEALTMGMRGIVQNALTFDGVRVNEDDRLGRPGAGMAVAQDAMMLGRLSIAAVCVGGLKRCSQLALRFASRRTVATGRLIDNGAVRRTLDDQVDATAALETLVRVLGRRLDEGRHIPPAAYAACKVAGPELLFSAADRLVQMLGSRGYVEANPASRMLRDARGLRIFEGPTETLEAYLGAAALAADSELNTFLVRDCAAPKVAARLSAMRDALAGAPTGHAVTAAAGRAATWAIMVGVTEATPGSGSEAWASGRLDRALEEVASIAGEDRTATSSLETRIGRYAETIGNVEETAPGEDVVPDPLCARDNQGDAPASAPAIAAPAPIPSGPRRDTTNDDGALADWLAGWVAARTGAPPATINRGRPFAELGIDSMLAVELALELGRRVGAPVAETILWEHPTIAKLARHIEDSTAAAPPSAAPHATLDALRDLTRGDSG